MTYTQSNLSYSNYGYDIVVATTQASINANIRKWLRIVQNKTNPVSIYFIQDNNNNVVEKNDLSVDPFAIAVDPKTNKPLQPDMTSKEVASLNDQGFYVGFQFALGLPIGAKTIVTFDPVTNTALYNLTLKRFNIIKLDPGSGRHPKLTWNTWVQDEAHPWLLTSRVVINFPKYDSTYSAHLSPEAQAKLNPYVLAPEDYSINQLAFDFNTAEWYSQPAITGIDNADDVVDLIQRYLLGKFFVEAHSQGHPPIGLIASALKPSKASLHPVNTIPMLNGYTPASGDTGDLTTFNYVSSVWDHKLPASLTKFTWNWIESNEIAYHGTIAINRNTFRDYLEQSFMPIATKCCLLPGVTVKADFGSVFANQATKYDVTFAQNGTPTVEAPSPDHPEIILTYTNNQSGFDQAGINGGLGSLRVTVDYRMEVSVKGTKLTIVQELKIAFDAKIAGAFFVLIDKSATPLDKKVTDVFVLEVISSGDDSGKLRLTKDPASSTIENTSDGETDLSWFTALFDQADVIRNQIIEQGKNAGDYELSVDMSTLSSFFFPGGNVFTFVDPMFSDNQDLIAHIIYLKPESD